MELKIEARQNNEYELQACETCFEVRTVKDTAYFLIGAPYYDNDRYGESTVRYFTEDGEMSIEEARAEVAVWNRWHGWVCDDCVAAGEKVIRERMRDMAGFWAIMSLDSQAKAEKEMEKEKPSGPYMVDMAQIAKTWREEALTLWEGSRQEAPILPHTQPSAEGGGA